jgi:hypothetical protein
MFCQYKDIFGKTREDAHTTRIPIIDAAFVDVFMTVLFSFIFSYVTGIPVKPVMVTLFILGIIAHRVFCVKTKVDTLLFE